MPSKTVWLTKEQMAILFERDRTVISRHTRNIFQEGDLDERVVCAKNAHTTLHGALSGKTQTNIIDIYNLDVIISVGYRVKSQRGTQFRIWANSILKDYLIKGYAVKNDLVQHGWPFFYGEAGNYSFRIQPCKLTLRPKLTVQEGAGDGMAVCAT